MRLLLILVFATSTILSSTLRITANDRNAISASLVKAQPNDTILLAPGIYRENIIVTTGVTIKAEANHSVTIKGDGRGTVVTLSKASQIEGCIITGGNMGVSCNYADAQINNCIIIENVGSGIFSLQQFPKVYNTVIARNEIGITATGVISRIQINQSTIAQNRVFGIAFNDCRRIEITNSLFFDNKARHFSPLPLPETLTLLNIQMSPSQKELQSQEILVREPLFGQTKEQKRYYLMPKIDQKSESPQPGAASTPL